MGELRGLSRWRSRFQGIGLDEKLIAEATEKSGMMLVQIERFMKVLTTVEQQFSNFFNWLLKCIKLLMQEPNDQLLPYYNSELVVIFLKFLYDQDPVRKLLDPAEVDHPVEVDLETMQRVQELVQYGGFSDTEYLRRTLAKEFEQMESRGSTTLEVVLLSMPTGYTCADLSLYKDGQVVLLLNGTTSSPEESSGDACMMIIQADELPFIPIPRSSSLQSLWKMHHIQDSAASLEMENEKARSIPHSVIAPLAVSATRGVACVFAARKRALVYILEEDEDDVLDTEG
ncbi:Anaphase-promoting complex subunit 4 [Linum perenne]